MAKISLDSIVSGFKSVSKLIANFDKIEDDLNDKVLYRDNPTGEPNQMENNLDMNSQRIVNLVSPVNDSEPARWADVKNGVTGIEEPVPSQTGNAKTPLTTNGTGLVFGQIEADHVDFTNSGTGGVERTLQAKLEDVVNVKDFGAVGDGVTDDTAAIQAALDAAADGSVILFPPTDLGYGITTGNIDLPASKTVHLQGNGVTLNHNNTTNSDYVFGLDFGVAPTSPHSQIVGFTFTKTVNGTGVAIRNRGTNHQVFKDLFIVGYDKAFEIKNEALSTFSEALHFENIDLRNNNYGFHYSIGSGNASFATQYYSNVRIAMPTAVAAVAYGFYLGTGCDIYRSTFSGMTIFSDKTDCVGYYSDGRMRNCRGSINIEGNNGGVTGNTGFLFDTNVDLSFFEIDTDIRGTVANKIVVNTPNAIGGLRTSSLANVGAEVIKSSKLSGIRAVVEEDLTTFRMVEKVTSAGVYQWQTEASVPPEFVDSSTGGLSPVRLLNVGNVEKTAADGDTTPSVSDTTRLLVNQTTAPTTISDFDDGVDGQVITIRFNQSTFATTVSNNVNIQLNASSNWSPTNTHSTLTLMNYGGTIWREIGRMAI